MGREIIIRCHLSMGFEHSKWQRKRVQVLNTSTHIQAKVFPRNMPFIFPTTFNYGVIINNVLSTCNNVAVICVQLLTW